VYCKSCGLPTDGAFADGYTHALCDCPPEHGEVHCPQCGFYQEDIVLYFFEECPMCNTTLLKVGKEEKPVDNWAGGLDLLKALW